MEYNYKGGARLIHLGKCRKSAGSKIPELECSTASQDQSEVPYSVNLDGGFAKLWQIKDYKGKHLKLIDTVGDFKTLIAAYEIIKSKPGNMAFSANDETLVGISDKWFKDTSAKLKNGCFKFKTARRVEMYKPNKSSKRALTIENPRDKIVQQAICMALEQVFEPAFLTTSHGFRASKGCHSALKQIKLKWSGISWFLEFGIYKCFYEMDKHRLVNILREKIDDQRFLDLIYKLFNAGTIGWSMKSYLLPIDVPIDCVISPILCNIYLHKLDLEVEKIQKEFELGSGRQSCRKFRRVTCVPKTKVFNALSVEKYAVILRHKQNESRKMELTRTDWNDPDFVRVFYVRYADNLLFGIAGPKNLVILVKKRIIQFVKSDLKLELIGGEITHIASGKVLFLGVEISGVSHSKFPQRFNKALEKKKRVKNRLVMQRKIKEDRILKALQLGLKKAVKSNISVNIKDSSALKMKFQAIKNSILSEKTFAHSSITSYKEFLKSLYTTHVFVPNPLKDLLKTFENELINWENSLERNDSSYFEKKYKKLIREFVALPLRINVPLKELREKLRSKGILTKSNKPTAVTRIATQPDHVIVRWFCSVGQGFLNYYRCCNNFYRVKNYVDYFIRWSAIHTLANKYQSSCSQIIFKWSKDLVILDSEGHKLADFPNNNAIRAIGCKFLANVNRNNGLRVLNSIWFKFSRFKLLGIRCAFKDCNENDLIEMHHIREFSRLKDLFDFVSAVTKKGRRATGIEAFKIAYNRKHIPLCRKHHQQLNAKIINLFDLDWYYVRDF